MKVSKGIKGKMINKYNRESLKRELKVNMIIKDIILWIKESLEWMIWWRMRLVNDTIDV